MADIYDFSITIYYTRDKGGAQNYVGNASKNGLTIIVL